MADIKIKDKDGNYVEYAGVSTIKVVGTDGNQVSFSSGGGSLLDYTVTFMNGDDSVAIYSVPEGYAVSAPASPAAPSGKILAGWGTSETATTYANFPYTPTESQETLYAVFQTAYSGTVAGLGSSSPSSVTFDVNDGLFDGITEVKVGSNVFIKIPKMYRKVVTSSNAQITSFKISVSKLDSDYEVYPCFLKEDGVTEMDYILIGKYCSTSSSVANSVNGTAITATPSVGRAICQAVGDGYMMMDWMIFKLWQDLLICKMKTVNTNSGSGIGVDALGVSWENSGSKTYAWIDGINITSSKQWIFSYKPSKYVDSATSSTDGYQAAGYTFSGTSGQEILALGYDGANPFLNYPKSTTDNSSYNTYYCDAFYFGTSATNPVRSDVGFADASCGAFRALANGEWSTARGVRLCYRPLTE